MDYQTFNSPQHLPPSFGGPYSTTAPAPSLSSPQPLYQEPQARLQQSNPQANPQANPSFPYQQFANGQPPGFAASMPGAGPQPAGGAVMQPGGLSQSQLHARAPFAHALASPAHQQFVQNRQTASPAASQHQAASPYATPQQTHSPTAQQTQAMNPPQSQSQPPMLAHAPGKQLPPSPVSPVAHAREKQRIDTLLDINQLLIQQVMDLHAQGKAGHIGPAPDAKPDGEKQQQPSPEYRDYMRRLQANLAFLAQNAERHTKPNQNIMPGPAIMVAPSSPDELAKLYAKLQGLFPGWKGAPNKPSPGPQRLNSTSSQASLHSSMQPPNSAGLQNNMQPPNSAGLPPNMQLPSNANPLNSAVQNNIQQQQ